MIGYQQEDEMLEIDALNPIERYKRFQQQIIRPQKSLNLEGPDKYRSIDVGELSLIALYVIDISIKREFNTKYSFYIQDDTSVKYLLSSKLNYEMHTTHFMKYLLLVDDAKLIYRFTCAKKFEINNEKTKQLRLNSWGRQYIEDQQLLIKYSEYFNQLMSFFSEYMNEYRNVYAELIKLLLEPITSSISYDISRNNQCLTIKLLS